MKIILLGAPGSGKGTLAKQISAEFKIPQISTGDLFRAAIKEETELGLKVKSIIAGGGLVSDDITVSMLKERIAHKDCENGFILDGFPRTIAQAEALERMTDIDAIILIELDSEVIVKRLSGRRTCLECREIYNINSHASDTCDKCGATLVQRDDDKPESIKNRLEVYENTTSPLINFYSDRLFKVSGEGTPEDTYRPVKTYLESLEG